MPSRWDMSTDGYVDPVERQIRAAIERGDFDHLPGAGKPIPDLAREYEPGWWAKRFLERVKVEDAARDLRALIRSEMPKLRVMEDREAAMQRIAEINEMVDEVNARLPEGEKVGRVE